MTNADTTGLRPAIFMDRDNTLTVDAKGYTWRLSDFALIDGAAESLALFHKLGLPVFVVTNQGGIGKGLYSRDDMQHFHDRLAAEAIAAGGMITDFAFCPHHPDAHDPALRTPCSWRKPAPGMILALAERWQIDLAASVMVGDRDSDVAAGKAAGCHAYRFDGGNLLPLSQHILTGRGCEHRCCNHWWRIDRADDGARAICHRRINLSSRQVSRRSRHGR